MSLLTMTGVTLRMGGRTLLQNADLNVDAGRRIGLVGRNGAGKSTLLKAISGEIGLDGGDIRLASSARLAYIRQEAPSGEASLLDTVLEGDPERLALLAEAERHDVDPDRLAHVYERLNAIEAESAPARAAGEQFFRRLAHARGLGKSAVFGARPAAAGRADQPSRS